MVTIGTFADRFGRVYGHAIEPDQYLDGDGGQVQTHAAAWIHAAGQAGESVRGYNRRTVEECLSGLRPRE